MRCQRATAALSRVVQIVAPLKSAGTEQNAVHDVHIDICGVSTI